MTKEERKAMVERIAMKFVSLQDTQKSFVAGYMARAEEENGANKQKAATA